MSDQPPPHIIDKLGGPAALAKALKAKPSAVSNWKLDGRGIPFKFRPAIARLAAERAISLPDDFWRGMAA